MNTYKTMHYSESEALTEMQKMEAIRNPILVHRPFVPEVIDDVKVPDYEAQDPIKNLELCASNGDTLAENALNYFNNTLWGKEYIDGKRSFLNAVDCIENDVYEHDYYPAKSQKQANLFLKRLKASVKYKTVKKVVQKESKEYWYIDYIKKPLKSFEKIFLSQEKNEMAQFIANCEDPELTVEKKVNITNFGKYDTFIVKYKNFVEVESYDPSDEIIGWGNAYGD